METQQHTKGNRAVATWLIMGVGMIIVQVILGGITRLTGSGLSITEWEVVTGSFPPMNQDNWMNEFRKYQETPQYRLLNTDFTLSDFKFIYFWEWFHRVWARLIGIVFVAGFVWLSAKKYLRKEMINPLLVLFLLGALQGAVGWIMVASGLTGDAVYVKPTRLALHFILALLLLCYTWWFTLQLLVPAQQRISCQPIKKLTIFLLVLMTIQLIFGALMAGHRAATVAPTWPTINGDWLPSAIWQDNPLLLNLIDNPITIHFIHRNLAYLIVIMVIIWYRKMSQADITPLIMRWKRLPLILTVIQVLLGIFSVLTSKTIIPNHWGNFEWMAQLHQMVAMILLLSMVSLLYLFNKPRQQA